MDNAGNRRAVPSHNYVTMINQCYRFNPPSGILAAKVFSWAQGKVENKLQGEGRSLERVRGNSALKPTLGALIRHTEGFSGSNQWVNVEKTTGIIFCFAVWNAICNSGPVSSRLVLAAWRR